MRLSCSAIPPLIFFCGLGRTCFLTMRTCSTSSLPSAGKTRSTRRNSLSSLPRPVMTFTMSFLRTSTCVCIPKLSRLSVLRSQYLRRKRDNLQKFLFAQFAGHRSENARPYWLAGLIDEHCGVLVKADVGAVAAPVLLACAHHNRFYHRSLFRLPIRRGLFDARRDHVAQAGVQARRAAKRQNHLQLARAGLIGHVDHRSHHACHLLSPNRQRG